jgi:hypothetical protein
MKGRPAGFEEVATADDAGPLLPGATARMTVGAEIAEPHPTVILTVGIGIEMGGGVHLASTATRGGNRQWWRGRRLNRGGLGRVLTDNTARLVGET